jgi:hypothetical protein
VQNPSKPDERAQSETKALLGVSKVNHAPLRPTTVSAATLTALRRSVTAFMEHLTHSISNLAFAPRSVFYRGITVVSMGLSPMIYDLLLSA